MRSLVSALHHLKARMVPVRPRLHAERCSTIRAPFFAHYQRGEKANQKANDHAKSAGLYLAEAKRRIDAEHPYGERTRVWTVFLEKHCPLRRTRAEQLIAIATGKTTEVEVQMRANDRKKAHRAKAPDSLSFRNDKVQPALPSPPTDERSQLLTTIHERLAKLSTSRRPFKGPSLIIFCQS